MGATRWEATQASIQRCVRVALTPILNQMNVVGIVSIPGMMTGQILSGSDPSQVLLDNPQCYCCLMSDMTVPNSMTWMLFAGSLKQSIMQHVF